MKKHFYLLAAVIGLAACTSEAPKESEAMVEPEIAETQPLLSTILTEKKERFLEKADSAKISDYDAGLQAVEETGILNTALNVGDTAKDFALPNQKGEELSLQEMLKDGPVVLTWYRGGWCPYCNITLAFLQEKLPEFKEAGGQLVAITPELPDSSLSTIEKNKLDFTVLSDVGNNVARNYGVVFQLTDAVAERYQNGFDLHAYNGDDSNELPLAATYVIGIDGVVKYAFLDVDYRNRAEPDDILEALKALK